ncbi:hypothetical protein [Rothia sp. ZJ1223]|uniref:hypothetical protein n=1 Tax=Rothia sp. ZJ1223 TaxID=2811098 RepID=UPI00195C2A0B|nr:hypothetical protein [Rothia sp. ZJ1223]MBM7051715.1 hypothetical protein [Rothia sp. ZJ1223]
MVRPAAFTVEGRGAHFCDEVSFHGRQVQDARPPDCPPLRPPSPCVRSALLLM